MVAAAGTGWGKGWAVEAYDLSKYRWRNRLLLIFTPSEDFPAYQKLVENLKQKQDGVMDRDLIVFHLMGDGKSRVGEAMVSSQDTESLRRRFRVAAEEFRVVLVGKDGTVKLSESVVKLPDIFALIDSMPMRQREMREKQR